MPADVSCFLRRGAVTFGGAQSLVRVAPFSCVPSATALSSTQLNLIEYLSLKVQHRPPISST